jgi:DNA-binding protein HU-beta
MASKPATEAKAAAAPKAAAKKPRTPVMAVAKKPSKPSAPKTAPKAAPVAPVMAAPKKPASKATPKAAPVVAPKRAETVALKAVFEQLAEAQDMPKKQAIAMATGMVDLVTSILKAGDRVRLNGLGILEVKDRPARMGRNPASGAAVQIAASKKVAFRAAKELKEAV